MATHESWIIDGNYNSSWDIRLAEADIILWLKIHRTRCIYRVISRSLQNRFFSIIAAIGLLILKKNLITTTGNF